MPKPKCLSRSEWLPTTMYRRFERSCSPCAPSMASLEKSARTDADLDDLEVNYFRGGGCFEVVEDAMQRIVGCAGLRPLTPCRVELCKMYLEKSARGQGLGKRLLEELLAAARRSGFREVWLKTNSVLTEAITLYKKYGFQPVDAEHLPPRCDVAYLLRLG